MSMTESEVDTVHLAVAQTVAGTDVLVAAVAGKAYRVLSWFLSATADATVKFQSKPTGTAVDLTGTLTIVAKAALGQSAVNDRGLFQTVRGSGLQLTSATTLVTGYIVYLVV
jgi:hypothetical protein